MDDYLKHRTNLCCVFALLDAGLAPQPIDVEFVEWLARNSVPFVLVFTKTDKVTPATVQANIAAFTEQISGWFEKLPAIYTCSAMAKHGREELLGVIDATMAAIRSGSEQPQAEAGVPTEVWPPRTKRKAPGLPAKSALTSRAPGRVAGFGGFAE